MSELMPGIYKGKVVGCDAGGVGDNNTPVVKIAFKLTESNKTVVWQGWMSEKVNEKTGKSYKQLVIEKLIELGFAGSCLSELADPKARTDILFNIEKEWDLDISFQVDKNGVQTKYLQVDWINDPNRQPVKFDHVKSVQLFKGMNVAGDIARIRNEMGAQKPAQQAQMPMNNNNNYQQQQQPNNYQMQNNNNINQNDVPF